MWRIAFLFVNYSTKFGGTMDYFYLGNVTMDRIVEGRRPRWPGSHIEDKRRLKSLRGLNRLMLRRLTNEPSGGLKATLPPSKLA